MVWSDIAIADIATLQTVLNQKEVAAMKNAPNGYAPLDCNAEVPMLNLKDGVANGLATLDSGGKVPSSQLPTMSGVSLLDIDLRTPSASAFPQVTAMTAYLGWHWEMTRDVVSGIHGAVRMPLAVTPASPAIVLDLAGSAAG